MTKQKRYTGIRPFKLDYAGAWPGHASTIPKAIQAATRHLTEDGYNTAVIIDKRNGAIVARCQISTDRKHVHTDSEHVLRKIHKAVARNSRKVPK